MTSVVTLFDHAGCVERGNSREYSIMGECTIECFFYRVMFKKCQPLSGCLKGEYFIRAGCMVDTYRGKTSSSLSPAKGENEGVPRTYAQPSGKQQNCSVH